MLSILYVDDDFTLLKQAKSSSKQTVPCTWKLRCLPKNFSG